jgi:hypothetical protein
MTGFLVRAGIALCRRLVPVRPNPEYTAAELDEFNKRYGFLEWGGFALFFVVLWPVSALLWVAFLVVVCRFRDDLMPAHLMIVRLRPDWLAWALSGFLLGMISGAWLLSLILRLYFGSDFCRLAQAAWNRKARYDTAKAFRWLSAVIVTLTVLWIPLELDWYTRLEKDRIVIHPLFSFRETAYPYNRITDLLEPTHLVAPNGNVVERTRQVVVFDDGEYWCHDGLLRDPQPLIDLLKAKTGKTFKRVRFIEDVVK